MTRPFVFAPRALDRLLAPVAAAERAARDGARAALGRSPVGPPTAAALRRPPAATPDAAAVVVLPALPWAYRFQRPQQLAAALAATGRPVLYVDPWGREALRPRRRLERPGGDLYRLAVTFAGRPDPFRRPLPRAAADALAAELSAGVRVPVACVVAQLPFWLPLATALRDGFGCPLVYDLIDLHAAFPDVPPEVAAIEDALLAEADLVTATSPALAARAAGRARRLLELPNGVALEDFPARAEPPGRPPERLEIGYVGALHGWFDAPAVAAAARAQPAWRLRLAGRVEDAEVAALGGHANVTLAGEIAYSAVAAFLAGLDVALIPFRDLPLTRAVDPVKLYEAFAVGVPVVARRLPGVERWEEPLLHRYDEPGQLAERVLAAAAQDCAALRRRRRDLAGRNTWGRRADDLLAAVGAAG